MQEPYRNASGSSKLTLLVISVAALAWFCFAAPSATAQTYTVTLTGGGGGQCVGAGTGGLTISGDTLEFLGNIGGSGGCYFGTTGYLEGPATCTAASVGASCADLGALEAGAQYTFSSSLGDPTNAGACLNSTTCTAASSTDNFVLLIPVAGFDTSSTTNLNFGGAGPDYHVGFDDPVPTPELASYLLFGSGLLGLGAFFRKKLGPGRAA